jgi:bifunctional aspartokinase / homoserine dehydrogenase 1
MTELEGLVVSVQKVGGSCLSSKDSILQLRKIINKEPTVLVVSAFNSVTDRLQNCIDIVLDGKSSETALDELFEFHLGLIDSLIDASERVGLITEIKKDIHNIEKLLKSTAVIGTITDGYCDYILSFGEKWSALIIHDFLLKQKLISKYIHAKDFLIVHKDQSGVQVEWEKSKKLLNSIIKDGQFDCIVLTGFIASDDKNNIVTLGRNGSDFTASIIAKLLHSKELIFWKDVESILSADPKIVKSAFSLENISYAEAMEMAHFGSTVLHPKSIFPAAELEIPISVRSFINLGKTGTRISSSNDKDRVVKAISHISDLSLITIDGNGLQSSTYLIKQLFTYLDTLNIHIYLTTQSSSEHSVCFAVKSSERLVIINSLNDFFKNDLNSKLVKRIAYIDHFSLIAVIGDNMLGVPGIISNCSRLLADANINIHAIAQGASERNISIVINQKNLHQAMKLIHSTFVSREKIIEILILGTGLIGSELFSMFMEEENHLLALGYRIQINAFINSKSGYFSEVNNSIYEQVIQKRVEPYKSLDEVLSRFDINESPHLILFDCTASPLISKRYTDFFEKGFHVIAANKIANSSSINIYKEIRSVQSRTRKKFFYETNVGAALPIIESIQSLRNTGDKISRIEGVFSGSLSYIFKSYTGEKSFSEIVREAQDKGFTEPDPRDDLNGKDVLRKLLILARETGLELNESDIDFQSLLAESDMNIDLESFYKKLEKNEKKYLNLLDSATKNGKRLTYYASLNIDGQVRIAIEKIDETHPAYNIKGGDNICIIYSKRYHQLPMIIQGPGAGAEITASGLYSDFIKLCSTL